MNFRKKTVYNTNHDKFNKYLELYMSNGCDFDAIYYGTTRKIIHGNKKIVFYHSSCKENIEGVHLCHMVKSDIDNYIKKNKMIPIPDKKLLQTVNKEVLPDVIDKKIVALAYDINYCYWQVAYNMGYISIDTFNAGIKSKKYKKARLVAIGTLAKIIVTEKYIDGKMTGEPIKDTNYCNKYHPFFWSIIDNVHNVMCELYDILNDDFYMFLTDCIFFNPEKKNQVELVLDKYNLGFKKFNVKFTGYNDHFVEWTNIDNGEKKKMAHLGKQSLFEVVHEEKC